MQKILIIEDDPVLGSTLKERLIEAGFDTKLCDDGEVGLQEISKFMPDLILLDIILPSRNGYEILQAKILNPEIRDIPVVIISNSGQTVEIQRALDMGVKDYLIKVNISPDEVLDKVELLMKKLNQTSPEENFEDAKVLIVEDDKFLIDLITVKLSKESLKVFYAKNGEEALEVAKKEKPDLILLDIILPGMDGFEILERLKSDEETKDIDVYFMSNLGEKGDIEKGKQMGAKGFIVKANFSLDEIIFKIKESLSEKRATS
jgi:DNA-binding response OmpR family regulator